MTVVLFKSRMDSTKKRPSERNFKEKNLSTFPIPRQLYVNRIGHILISHFPIFRGFL